MHKDVESILFTQEQIAARVKELGRAVREEYAGKELVMVCVLKGACVFFADLLRSAEVPAEKTAEGGES